MRFLISVAVAALTAYSVQAQTKEQQVEAIQQRIADLQEQLTKFTTTKETYTAGAKQAVATGRPLVTFLGHPSRPIAGCEVAYTKALAGYSAPAVVISVPGQGWLEEKAVLPATSTDVKILEALRSKAVSRPAAPFTPSEQPAERDADLPDEVSSILDNMVRYRTTRVAQVSGNRSGGGANSTVSRLSIPSKWQQPGGLEGLTGWSNRLYRKADNPVRNWLGHVDANDRWADGRVISNWGGLSEITYQRQYGEGAKFADVLSTSTGVFEVRLAEKINGEWRRSIPYRDQKAEPTGYKRVNLQQCAECHNQAGDGQYGTARIIGGDGVLSDPFQGLE